MISGSSNDPFTLGEHQRSDTWGNNRGYGNLTGRTLRITPINPAQKTLVLITAGQSNMSSLSNAAYVIANPTKIDNFNIYDGAMYEPVDPLLGQGWLFTYGDSSITTHLADKFITNGVFDRVIVVPMAVPATAVALWTVGGPLYDRLPVAIRRLAARGITPSTPGVTFAMVWLQGESDNGVTSQANYTARLNAVIARMVAAGFSGRSFVCTCSMLANVVDANIQAAQAAVRNGTTVFDGGNIDSLTGATYRIVDGTHLTGANGIPTAATLIYNAMRATGAPL